MPHCFRNIARGKVWRAPATRVVRDEEDLVALYWAPGYLFKPPAGDRQTLRAIWLDDLPLNHIDCIWEDLEVLSVMKPGAGHATWMVRRDGEFLGWYVNLQRPIVRTALGFDSADLQLDIIIRPDLVTYQWKDEDELAEDVERGFVTLERPKRYGQKANGSSKLRMGVDHPSMTGGRSGGRNRPGWRLRCQRAGTVFSKLLTRCCR
jgi:hypothetical protein